MYIQVLKLFEQKESTSQICGFISFKDDGAIALIVTVLNV